MSAKSRTKGATYEREVAAWLRGHGFPHAERAVRNGWRTATETSADLFDILGTPGLLWSLKNLAEVSEEQLRRYLAEVETVAAERGLLGLLVVKRNGRSDIGSSWCYRTVALYGVEPEIVVRTSLAEMAPVLRAQGYGSAAA